MPMLEPSCTGFTMAGQAAKPSSSSGPPTTVKGAVGIPWWPRISFVRPLSRQSDMVRESLPV